MEKTSPEAYGTSMVRPEDFDLFWEQTLTEAAAIPLNPALVHLPLRSTATVDVFEVHYASWAGVRIAGWYCRPVGAEGPLPAVLQVPGYNQDPPIPKGTAQKGYAAFFVAPRGKLRSTGQFNPGYPGLLTHNIVDRNTYSYRGFYIDAVRAFQFLCSRAEVDPHRIGITGSSQGGALTLAVAGLCPQLKAAAAGAPYLCGFMDAIELTRTYPYEEISDYLRRYPHRREAVRQTLGYFDCIHFGPRIHCPIIVNLGLQDNICPPETGYAAYEAIAAADKRIYAYDGYGHDAGREQHEVVVWDFFEQHLKA